MSKKRSKKRACPRKSKKAQGISINVIIIAAIALLVLVVLSVIFLGKLNVFGEQTASCETQGGQCNVGICNPGQIKYPVWSCDNTPAGAAQVCCINAGV